MQVLVPKRSFFAKILGSALLALTMSLGANAMDQNQKHNQSKAKHTHQHTEQTAQQFEVKDECQDNAQSQECSNQQSQDMGCSNQQSQSQVKGCSNQQSQSQVKGCSNQQSQSQDKGCSSQQNQDHFQGKSQDIILVIEESLPVLGARAISEYANQTSDPARFAQMMGPKKAVSNWLVTGSKEQRIGHKMHSLNWNGATLNTFKSKNLHLYHINALGAMLDEVWLHGHFLHVNFSESTVTNTTFSGKLIDVDFNYASLNNVLFTDAKFKRKHMKRSNFDYATLENVHFVRTKMEGLTFKDAHLKNVTFECSSIKHSTFKDANIYVGNRYIKLSGNQLEQLGAYLGNTKKTQINLSAWAHNRRF